MDDPPPRVKNVDPAPETVDAPVGPGALETGDPVNGVPPGARTENPGLARFVRFLLVMVVVVGIAGLLTLVTDAQLIAVVGAVVLGAVILRVGVFFLQQFATPPPPPPDPGTLRKVRLTYRCEICGTEVRMTSAATEDPEPPRHCMEDMDLVSSQE